MAQKQFKIGLSNADKQNMAQDVYERVLALTFNEYDTATEYEVGDFVVYNDQLYKCIGATSGAWDSTKWQQATLQDLLNDIEGAVAFVNDKANVDGNYPTMTVGAADNLTPYDEDSGTDQEQPFLLQGTGCDNGEQQVDTGALGLLKEKQGHTVVVNQKLNDGYSYPYTLSGYTATKNGDTIHVTGTGDIQGYVGFQTLGFDCIKDHKYLLIVNPRGTAQAQTGTWQIYADGDGFSAYQIENNAIFTASNNGRQGLNVAVYGDQLDIYYSLLVIDLTQWFGSNDNIPAHLLAHPEDFFRYYQGSLAYNEGTLVNANGRYLKTIGRNQYKEGESYTQVIPNSTYHFYNADGNTDIYYYDKDKNLIRTEYVISNSTFHTDSNCVYIAPSRTANTCISIYYDGESGYDQYYPYEELANIDTGTETLRSAGSVKDTKAPDGTITRRVGYVDLGSLSWSYVSGLFSATLSGSTTSTNLQCAKYLAKEISGNASASDEDKTIYDYNGTIYVKDDSYSSASDFTTAMSGVVLNYELAEPTTEQGTTFSENVAIDDFGSMDFGGTNGVPQGASIFYAVDYKAFIDSLYNTLDGDATDIVKESELDSKLATIGYVKLTSVSGYDATKTQVLKNVEGTITWVTEE